MNFLWINGKFLRENESCISPFDRGFLYGDGIFETLKAESGSVEFLNEHIERLKTSASELNISVPSCKWDIIIEELIGRNNLHNQTARIKIILTRGKKPGLGLPNAKNATCIITACKQVKRPAPKKIGIYPEPRIDPVAKYKSLNYLFNMIACQWASENGYDEAVLLGSSGEILECTTSNIFVIRDKTVIKPRNKGHYLEGIYGSHFIKNKRTQGFEIKEQKIKPEDITDHDTVYITNSIIGACSVELESKNDKK